MRRAARVHPGQRPGGDFRGEGRSGRGSLRGCSEAWGSVGCGGAPSPRAGGWLLLRRRGSQSGESRRSGANTTEIILSLSCRVSQRGCCSFDHLVQGSVYQASPPFFCLYVVRPTVVWATADPVEEEPSAVCSASSKQTRPCHIHTDSCKASCYPGWKSTHSRGLWAVLLIWHNSFGFLLSGEPASPSASLSLSLRNK
ncbi:uncharacterized protein LOC123926849 isoform X2 [Meles meles]|uniref:uncharacterized protein LOC123926849 isoform X2 n=1 Tax=Meles meles TaxID=9662 RepID=UPI001E69A824|nr:uncharacterized protein LOC123926849 isoform X2 [Meles meles]